jgi:hypothetical protein
MNPPSAHLHGVPRSACFSCVPTVAYTLAVLRGPKGAWHARRSRAAKIHHLRQVYLCSSDAETTTASWLPYGTGIHPMNAEVILKRYNTATSDDGDDPGISPKGNRSSWRELHH